MTPVTIPVEPIVAIVVFALVHVPPPVISASVVVAPASHTDIVPVMAAGTTGSGFIVAIMVVEALPQPLVAV